MRAQTAPYVFGILILSLLPACDFYRDYENNYNGNVEGIIRDSQSGEALEGVTVYYDYFDEGDYYLPEAFYYYYEPDESTVSDAQGKFLIRNLEEKREYVMILRKWPGYEQENIILSPTPQQTDRYEIYLDPATASFSTDPEELHFPTGVSELYLVLLNHGKKPFNWTMSSDEAWLNINSTFGTLEGEDAEVIFVNLRRTYVEAFPASGSLDLTIYSTGETFGILVTADQ